MIIKSILLIRKREEDVRAFLLWILSGLAIIIVSVNPAIADNLLRILGMEQRVYAIFTLGILIVFLLVFRMSRQIRKLKEDISKLNEAISIQN